MNPTAKLSELVEPLCFSTDFEHEVYFDRQTAEIVIIERSLLDAVEAGDEADPEESLPNWQKRQIEIAKALLEDGRSRFIDPPDKVEFNEYQHMENFIETIGDPHIAGQLSRAIRGRGAFGRFKDALGRFGLENRWYRYLDQAMKEFAIEWAKDNDVPYEDDLTKMKRDR